MIHLTAFRLATHASAALDDQEIEWGSLPEFSGEADWTFYIPGPNGRKLRKTPGEWIETMRGAGARQAWYGYGPPEARGFGVWTQGTGGQVFYLAAQRSEGGVLLAASLDGRSSKSALPAPSVAAATQAFEDSLPSMHDYALSVGHLEFAPYFQRAMDLLAGRQNPPDWIDPMFPSLYPHENRRLLAAAHAGDVIGTGGMGWWTDFNPPDPRVFASLTAAYREVLFPAFVAASRLDLP